MAERKPYIIARDRICDLDRHPVKDRKTGHVVGYVQRDAFDWVSVDPAGTVLGYHYLRDEAARRAWERRAEVPRGE